MVNEIYFNLGGSNSYKIEISNDDECLHYRFTAKSKKDIIKYLGDLYSSRVYMVKERGITRVHLINSPSVKVIFIEENEST